MKMQSWIDPLQSIPPRLLLLDCQFRGAFSLPPSSSLLSLFLFLSRSLPLSSHPSPFSSSTVFARSSSRPPSSRHSYALFFFALAAPKPPRSLPRAFTKLTINRTQYGPKKRNALKSCEGCSKKFGERERGREGKREIGRAINGE